MQLILFSFAFDPETKALTYTANIDPPEARLPMVMKILQDALVAEALQRASENEAAKQYKESKPKLKEKSK